jgi:hypothetical protein
VHFTVAAVEQCSWVLQAWRSGISSSVVHCADRAHGEDTTVHQLGALPDSPGDGDVSMELTNIYAEEHRAAMDEPVAAELAAPTADGGPEAAVPEGAAQPAEAEAAIEQPAAAPQDSSAVAKAASPEPLMRLEDDPAATSVAGAADGVEAQEVQAAPEAAQESGLDPYELPASPALLDAAAPQDRPGQLTELLDVALESNVPQQQQTSAAAPAATALSSQLAAGSPPLLLGSPQLLQLDGDLPQPTVSGDQSGSFCNQGGQRESIITC